MPKAPPPVHAQRDCRFDHLVVAALSKGYGVVLVLSGIATEERGHEIRRGIFRCARHREISADAGPSRLVDDAELMGLRAVGNEYELRFRLWTKAQGRRRLIQHHGTDRSAWPYDPRRSKTKEDTDYWSTLGLNEKGHKIK